MSRTREETWAEILRTAWLVRSGYEASFERVSSSLALGEGDTVPRGALSALGSVASDAIILVGLIEEHERAYPTEAGARLPPQPG